MAKENHMGKSNINEARKHAPLGVSREDKRKGSEYLLHNNLIFHNTLADNKQPPKC